VKKNAQPYPVDGARGRLSFETYHKENAYGEVLYKTSRAFFSPVPGEEKYCPAGCKEIGLIYGATEESSRKTSALLNRMRHQEEGGTLLERSERPPNVKDG
jgi:hypothetical protein